MRENPRAAVRVEAGLIEGVQSEELTVYKAIPYAAAPVGDLRWRAPQPMLPWNGVRRADAFGPIAMQSGSSVPGAPTEPVSEDCLTLNVWTQATSGAAKLPVLVWIPGGGFTKESASMPLYWGDTLATRGVIVVTINYRVGLLGFLAHPDLSRESGHNSSGNYGLLDQIAALAWIKRNIAAFGGDPERVTIWGQSAGSMSVSLQMASPLARGLFQRAIGHSGGFFVPPAATRSPDGKFLKGAEEQGVRLAADLGATSLEALRNLAPEQFLREGLAGTTLPIVDGYVMVEEAYATFAAGRQNDVPLLIGSNADEGRPMLTGKNIRLATFAEDIGEDFGSTIVRELAEEYLSIAPVATDRDAWELRAAFERDLRFGWDTCTWARLHAEAGRAKVYYYYFSHVPPYPPESPFSDWGAGHWAELRYVFDHLNQEPWAWTQADQTLASTMATYVTNFAKSGNPNGEAVPVWPNFTTDSRRVLHVDDAVTIGGVPNLDGLRLLDRKYQGLRFNQREHDEVGSYVPVPKPTT
ncbi:MAG TPA: carboxylesterase family protein [Chloroflexota bacterium]|nr:carboxylesterase family protein [Chloroflexota bacterium]